VELFDERCPYALHRYSVVCKAFVAIVEGYAVDGAPAAGRVSSSLFIGMIIRAGARSAIGGTLIASQGCPSSSIGMCVGLWVVALNVLFTLFLFSLWIKLNHHILALAGSRVPLNIRLSAVSCRVTLALMKVTVHPTLQNWPTLTRLLVNVGIIWPVFVPEGNCSISSVSIAEDCNSCPDAVMMILVSAVLLMLVIGATSMKKWPLTPVSATAVQEGGKRKF
jgi:hypothetical protein